MKILHDIILNVLIMDKEPHNLNYTMDNVNLHKLRFVACYCCYTKIGKQFVAVDYYFFLLSFCLTLYHVVIVVVVLVFLTNLIVILLLDLF